MFLCRLRRAQQFGLIPGSSALSHCFTCLSLCKYHGVWVTMTLYYILKSDIVLYKALYICIDFLLFVQHNTWFQNMIFRSKPTNPELRFPAISFPTCARPMFTCCNPHRARYQIARQGLCPESIHVSAHPAFPFLFVGNVVRFLHMLLACDSKLVLSLPSMVPAALCVPSLRSLQTISCPFSGYLLLTHWL